MLVAKHKTATCQSLGCLYWSKFVRALTLGR
jgi:hypothetical protein